MEALLKKPLKCPECASKNYYLGRREKLPKYPKNVKVVSNVSGEKAIQSSFEERPKIRVNKWKSQSITVRDLDSLPISLERPS